MDVINAIDDFLDRITVFFMMLFELVDIVPELLAELFPFMSAGMIDFVAICAFLAVCCLIYKIFK